MKTQLPILIILLSALQLSAGDMFRAVAVTTDSWEVTFREKGIRFRLMVGDFDRGVSGYLQTLRMKRSERLTLIEKHSRIELRPVDENGRKGIEIKTTHRDARSGQESTTTTFEPEHKAEQAAPSDGDKPSN